MFVVYQSIGCFNITYIFVVYQSIGCFNITDSLTSDYGSTVIYNRALSMPSKKKVGKGGVVIMWHTRLSHFITPLSIDDDIIVGVQLQIAPFVHAFIFQVYLPCSNHSVAV